MIKSKDFWDFLESKKYTFFSGVPCSILEHALAELKNHKNLTYIPAIRENVSLGIASGAYIAGNNSGILIQNSGLGNIINALTSFNLIYKIPVLMFITWRGYQGKDAPEHIIMGEKTLELLSLLKIKTIILSEDYKKDLEAAIEAVNKDNMPVAVIIKKGMIE